MAPNDDALGDVKPVSLWPATLSLFASTSTLICCVLPALLVSVGLGAVMAGLIETVPAITWFGKNKTWVFSGAGIILALSGWLQWRARNLPCPTDPAQAKACQRLRRLSWRLWIFAVSLFMLGTGFTYFGIYFI
ncbi:MAG: hypothetical protein ABJ275_02805 [Maricaulaceae bacterium]